MLEVIHYTDLKSPYAYLAFDPIMALADEFEIDLVTRPYTLDIPSFFSKVADRDPHQWRKVKYSYMDCRRLARRRGLKLYGPKEIYDTRNINIALLFAGAKGQLAEFCRDVFKRFFEHEINVESHEDVLAALQRCGVDQQGFQAYADGEGGRLHDQIRTEAEEMGVFGVPSLVVEGEIFWGGDRLDLVTARLRELAA